LYDDSIIVFYGDHFGLSKSDTKIDALVSDWLGYEYTYDNMLNIPLIIHIPGTEVNEKVSIAGGQIDLMPTLAYLMGFETLDTIYLGRNLLTAKSGLVPIQTHMIKGSFIKDEVVLEMSRDGIFENSKAWNRYTGEEITDTSPYFKDYVKAKEMVELNTFYLYNDILRRVYVENKDMDAILRQLDGDDQPQTKMQLFYLKSTDEVGLGDFVAYMKQHVDKKVLLSSDDLHALLTHFENTFSGVSGEPGTIKSVDQAVNADYLQIKSRIIPLLDGVTGYTKLEYLGYTDIMVRLKIMDYTSEQIREFIMVNDPYAIALDYTDLKSQSNELLRGETPVFLYGERTEWQEALAKAMGAYGCVDSLMPIN